MEDLSLHVLDVVENAIRAHATRIDLSIQEEEEQNRLTIRIRDNGKGMTQEAADKACDPFFTTKAGRRTGLGLPLWRQSAEETGGRLDVQSKPGEGTEIIVVFHTNHPDMRPMGDMLETIAALLTANRSIRIVVDITTHDQEIHFDSWVGSGKRVD